MRQRFSTIFSKEAKLLLLEYLVLECINDIHSSLCYFFLKGTRTKREDFRRGTPKKRKRKASQGNL